MNGLIELVSQNVELSVLIYSSHQLFMRAIIHLTPHVIITTK